MLPMQYTVLVYNRVFLVCVEVRHGSQDRGLHPHAFTLSPTLITASSQSQERITAFRWVKCDHAFFCEVLDIESAIAARTAENE
jgi:hypothetical protein